VSVDQVGSKDSDILRRDVEGRRPCVSVDQVGSKDSDVLFAANTKKHKSVR